MNLKPYQFNGTSINDGTYYTASFDNAPLLLSTSPHFVQAGEGQPPRYSGKELNGGTITLTVNIVQRNSISTYHNLLKALFNTYDMATHVLSAKDTDDSDAVWYIDATPVGSDESQHGVFRVTFALASPIWKQVTAETETTWTVTASGQTKTVTVDKGNLDVYPVIDISPQASGSTSYYQYMRFVKVYNPNTDSSFQSPYSINLVQSDASTHTLDTAALVTGGKMQANAGDFVAYLDGKPWASWVTDENDTDTKLWANLPGLAPGIQGTIEDAIAGAGTPTTITINDITNSAYLPDTDEYIFLIEDEIFTATNRIVKVDGQTVNITLGGSLTRAAKGTSAAAHSAGVTAIYIPHDIWLYYGATATKAIPSYRTAGNLLYTRRPMFDLSTSTSVSLVYADFRDADQTRAHGWTVGGQAFAGGRTMYYTGNQGTYSEPAGEMGLIARAPSTTVFWQYAHPYITGANFTNGEKYNLPLTNNATSYKGGRIMYGSTVPTLAQSYAIPATTSADTWQTWSHNTGTIAASIVRMELTNKTANYFSTEAKLEAADCTISLDADNVPVVRMGTEQAQTYELNAKITNTTTGESFKVNFPMGITQTLRIDTLNKTVKYLADNRNVYGAVVTDTIRDTWLRLRQGDNVLSYVEADVSDVDIAISWRGRNI